MSTDGEGGRIRVLLADDHKSQVEGLVAILNTYDDMEVVGVAHDGPQAVHICRLVHPDVVLLDINMSGGDGITAGPAMAELNPAPRILFFSAYANPEYVLRAIGLGAAGYLLKDDSSSMVVDALREVHAGGSAYSRAVRRIAAAMNVGGVKRRQSDPVLGDRERRVVRLLARGNNFRQTGEAMGISIGTVRTYWNRAIAKLGLKTMPRGMSPVRDRD